jgi:hypothetical protein
MINGPRNYSLTLDGTYTMNEVARVNEKLITILAKND